jgi:serine/threonine-protein kinase HipA
MMISKKLNPEAFIWIWLPGKTEPVVAGRLEADNDDQRTSWRSLSRETRTPIPRYSECIGEEFPVRA